jgi:hypothetical protein
MHLKASLHQIRNNRWHQRHAPFSRINFFGHTYDHVSSFLIGKYFGLNCSSLWSKLDSPLRRAFLRPFSAAAGSLVFPCMLNRNRGRSDWPSWNRKNAVMLSLPPHEQQLIALTAEFYL